MCCVPSSLAARQAQKASVFNTNVISVTQDSLKMERPAASDDGKQHLQVRQEWVVFLRGR